MFHDLEPVILKSLVCTLHSAYEEMGNAYIILVGKPEVKT
jgi:hypothetical protein